MIDIPYISLVEAEELAIQTSNTIKAYTAQANSALESEGAQFAYLLPYWTIDGRWQFNSHVPSFNLPGFSTYLPVGVHTPYTLSTTISYTIWDNLSNINAFKGSRYFAQSQKEVEDDAKLQILQQVRQSYLLVQLSLEELEAVQNSLELARSQFVDMDNRYKNGAVAQLDWIDSRREVLSYESQYQDERSTVISNVKDLFALLNLPSKVEIFEAESNEESDFGTELMQRFRFDTLEESLAHAKKWTVTEPTESQPSLRAQMLLSRSYEAQADSEYGKLGPKIDIFGTAQLIYPDVIQLRRINQNSYGATFTMPIFDGLRIVHKAAAAKQNALTALFNHDQLKINLNRDYQKALELLRNLEIQKEINIKDIAAAKKSAELYYESYKVGQSLLVNVQRANVQVLTTQVQGARITARMLEQLFVLQYLSGKIVL